MDGSNFNAAVDELRKQLLLVEGAAHQVASRFQTLCSEAEALKIATLKRRLENRRKSLALHAGATSITKDRQELGIALGVAALGMIFGGVIGRDKSSVLSGGVSAFKGALQGFGEGDDTGSDGEYEPPPELFTKPIRGALNGIAPIVGPTALRRYLRQ